MAQPDRGPDLEALDQPKSSEDEYAAAQKSAEARNTRFESGPIPQADSGEASRLTSLMSDPPNGRFPEMTAGAKAKATTMGGRRGRTQFDKPADFQAFGGEKGISPNM